jgi:NitT/TauT family transport system substrate-binding protein
MFKKTLLTIAVFFIVVGIAAPSFSMDKATIRLDWIRYGIHLPFFVGVEKGFYKEQGIDLEIAEGKGSGNTVKLIGSGTDTFGFASLATVAQAVLKGVPIKSVWVASHDSGYGVLFLSESGIKKPADLKGKNIGVSPGGTSRAIFPAFLSANGLKEDQLKTVAFKGTARMNSVLAKQIDAAVGPVPMYLPIMEDKGAADKVKIEALRFGDWNMSILGHGVLVNNQTIENNPDLIKRFISATNRSVEFARANPQAAVDAMAKGYLKPQPKVWLRDWELTQQSMQSKYLEGKPIGWQPKEEWQHTKDFLATHINKDMATVKLSDLYTNAYFK